MAYNPYLHTDIHLHLLSKDLGVVDNFNRFTPINEEELNLLLVLQEEEKKINMERREMPSARNLSKSEMYYQVSKLESTEEKLQQREEINKLNAKVLYNVVWARHVDFYKK